MEILQVYSAEREKLRCKYEWPANFSKLNYFGICLYIYIYAVGRKGLGLTMEKWIYNFKIIFIFQHNLP
jgi:hypothetical protein